MSSALLLALALVLILVNGFFVAVEFALMTVRRSRIEELVETNSFGARSVLRALDSINFQLAASQLGISVVSLIIGWLVEPVISEGLIELLGHSALPTGLVRALGFVIGLSIVAFVHMVLGEMVPRSIALTSSERTARILVPLHMGFSAIARPAVRVLHWLGRAGTRMVGVEPIDELAPSHTASELAVMVDEAHAFGQIEVSERDLLAGAFGFLNVTARDVMTPVSTLVTVPHSATIGEAERIMFESGHSRVLVMGTAADQVIGFLHAKDLINRTDLDRRSFLPPEALRPALRVSPNEGLGDVLVRMRRARSHVAVVLEKSQLIGLVTLEDVLEAIVGDINDESDLAPSSATIDDVPADPKTLAAPRSTTVSSDLPTSEAIGGDR
ncbi:MAG: hemolysin family protein [Microthrixaceae bacterium]